VRIAVLPGDVSKGALLELETFSRRSTEDAQIVAADSLCCALNMGGILLYRATRRCERRRQPANEKGSGHHSLPAHRGLIGSTLSAGTNGSQTLRWRKADSNFLFRVKI